MTCFVTFHRKLLSLTLKQSLSVSWDFGPEFWSSKGRYTVISGAWSKSFRLMSMFPIRFLSLCESVTWKDEKKIICRNKITLYKQYNMSSTCPLWKMTCPKSVWYISRRNVSSVVHIPPQGYHYISVFLINNLKAFNKINDLSYIEQSLITWRVSL